MQTTRSRGTRPPHAMLDSSWRSSHSRSSVQRSGRKEKEHERLLLAAALAAAPLALTAAPVVAQAVAPLALAAPAAAAAAGRCVSPSPGLTLSHPVASPTRICARSQQRRTCRGCSEHRKPEPTVEETGGCSGSRGRRERDAQQQGPPRDAGNGPAQVEARVKEPAMPLQPQRACTEGGQGWNGKHLMREFGGEVVPHAHAVA